MRTVRGESMAARRPSGKPIELERGRRREPEGANRLDRPIGGVDEEHRQRVVADHRLHSLHRGVEHVVEVERGGQRLGDSLQREEQRVGLGETADAIERQLLLPRCFETGAMGEAAGEGDQTEQAGPQQAVAQPAAEADLVDVLGGDRGDRGDAQLGTEEAAGGEPGEHAGGDQAQRERRCPGAGRQHDDQVHRLLADDADADLGVVAIRHRPDARDDGVDADDHGRRR